MGSPKEIEGHIWVGEGCLFELPGSHNWSLDGRAGT